jgi:type IV pilus assembly protein PilQ
VNDFATPVTTVDTLRTNLDTRIVISAEGKYEQLAYQSDNEFTIEINPAPEKTDADASLFSETKEYEGQRLTLNFQDIETRAVLQLLAETSGRNIVVSDTVQGNVTLRLRNVPWDQALDIVMTTKGLDMRQNGNVGNVILVAPAEEIAARETADLEAKLAIAELEPVYSEFLQVNYAKAADLASLIEGSGAGSMLSERGTIAVDDRTNTLLIQDTADRLQDIRRMVRTLDIPIKQVLIESRIVVVNDDFSRDIGVRFGVTSESVSPDGEGVVVTGTGEGANNYLSSIVDSINSGGVDPAEYPSLQNRYNVNVPIGNPAGRFALAVLDDDFLVDLELTAMEAEGRGEIVSTPRVITANQKQASIKQGVEIPYQQSASSGATTIQFKEAVLELTVTPQVTPDNNIIMDLMVSKDNVGDIISTGGLGGTVPSIDTRSVETQVLVKDGQTVVLGGIYETERRETITKVPVLGDIPFVGAAFRSKNVTNNKAELLIFVTPRILEEGSSIY